MNGDRLHTREQRIVATLEQVLPNGEGGLEKARARARNLPALIRRHGPLQTILFLQAKEGSDRKLAGWLLAGTRAALGQDSEEGTGGDPVAFATNLAGLDPSTYLLRWEAALEAATWLKLLVEARTAETTKGRQEEAGSTPDPAAGSTPEPTAKEGGAS